MYGRYGNDDLNKFLIYATLALILIGIFVRARWLHVITVLLVIVTFSRSMSRCYDKRQQENMKFLEIKNRIFGRNYGGGNYSRGNYSRKAKKAAKEGKRVLICPYCKEKLMVPVGSGKIKINCPHCHKQFVETV